MFFRDPFPIFDCKDRKIFRNHQKNVNLNSKLPYILDTALGFHCSTQTIGINSFQ